MRFLPTALLLAGCGAAPPVDDATTAPPEPPRVADDYDQDGFDGTLDCNDMDAGMHPDAPEVCNGLDDDCDLAVDEGLEETFYRDADGDTYGTASPHSACIQPLGYALRSGDCDDLRADVNPEQIEICDMGMSDEDCDGLADDDDPEVTGEHTFYVDTDGDGYGVTSEVVEACWQVLGISPTAGDCDDHDASANPGATEMCTGIDEDCDGLVDMDDGSIADNIWWYPDADGDGYGAEIPPVVGCWAPSGYIAPTGDCDDASAAIHPDVIEDCSDGLDNDCDDVAFCDPVGDLALGSADVVLDGAASDLMGADVAVGDSNGDGIADLVVSAPFASVVGMLGGGAYLFKGPLASVSVSDADATMGGEEMFGWYGHHVSLVDVDGDGYDDWVSLGAAAHFADLAYGPGRGPTAADVSVDGTDLALGTLASAVAPFDANGDGVLDLALGCDHAVDLGGVTGGGIVVLLGDPAGIDWADAADPVYLRLDGEDSGDLAGASVNATGDYDGDGQMDLLVGAPEHKVTHNSGAVYVWSGGLGGGTDSLASATAKLHVSTDGAAAGTAVASAGDFDFDGYDDIAVGAPGVGATVVGIAPGAVYVVLGPITGTQDLETTADLTLLGEGPDDGVGARIAGGGAINGDSHGTLLVGVPTADEGGSSTGVSYFLHGPLTGTHTLGDAAFARFLGEAEGDQSGSAVAFVPDQSGDGFDDIVVTGPSHDEGAGRAYVIYGEGLR